MLKLLLRASILTNSHENSLMKFASTKSTSKRRSGGDRDGDSSSSLSEHLDSVQNGQLRKKTTAKLSKGLEKHVDPEPSTAMQGVLESTAEEICGILNDALASNKLYKLFRGCPDASEAIDIEYVKINTDCSHATAFWKSSVIEKYGNFVAVHDGPEKGFLVKQRMNKFISATLQRKEPVFRTILIKHMDFRRVPRVFFKNFQDDK
jgi:ribosome-binding factor A